MMLFRFILLLLYIKLDDVSIFVCFFLAVRRRQKRDRGRFENCKLRTRIFPFTKRKTLFALSLFFFFFFFFFVSSSSPRKKRKERERDELCVLKRVTLFLYNYAAEKSEETVARAHTANRKRVTQVRSPKIFSCEVLHFFSRF